MVLDLTQHLRISDLVQYYWSTFQTFPQVVYEPYIVENANDIQKLIFELGRRKFRGKCIVGVDVECVSGPKACEGFNQHTSLPTHSRHSAKFARWISVSVPYGLTGIIDCSKIYPQTFDIFRKFLMQDDTVVVMFGAYEDLWSIHVTFGKIIPNTPSKPPYSAELRSKGILGSLRVFDLKLVVDLVSESDDGVYSPKKWLQAGLCPERKNLWCLSEALLGVNLKKYVLKLKPYEWANFWNARKLSNEQKLHICIDTQMTVNCFMALFRLKLIPCANEENFALETDYCSYSNLSARARNIVSSCNESEIKASLLSEMWSVKGFLLNPSRKEISPCFPGNWMSDELKKVESFEYFRGIRPDGTPFKSEPPIQSKSEESSEWEIPSSSDSSRIIDKNVHPVKSVGRMLAENPPFLLKFDLVTKTFKQFLQKVSVLEPKFGHGSSEPWSGYRSFTFAETLPDVTAKLENLNLDCDKFFDTLGEIGTCDCTHVNSDSYLIVGSGQQYLVTPGLVQNQQPLPVFTSSPVQYAPAYAQDAATVPPNFQMPQMFLPPDYAESIREAATCKVRAEFAERRCHQLEKEKEQLMTERDQYAKELSKIREEFAAAKRAWEEKRVCDAAPVPRYRSSVVVVNEGEVGRSRPPPPFPNPPIPSLLSVSYEGGSGRYRPTRPTGLKSQASVVSSSKVDGLKWMCDLRNPRVYQQDGLKSDKFPQGYASPTFMRAKKFYLDLAHSNKETTEDGRVQKLPEAWRRKIVDKLVSWEKLFGAEDAKKSALFATQFMFLQLNRARDYTSKELRHAMYFAETTVAAIMKEQRFSGSDAVLATKDSVNRSQSSNVMEVTRDGEQASKRTKTDDDDEEPSTSTSATGLVYLNYEIALPKNDDDTAEKSDEDEPELPASANIQLLEDEDTSCPKEGGV